MRRRWTAERNEPVAQTPGRGRSVSAAATPCEKDPETGGTLSLATRCGRRPTARRARKLRRNPDQRTPAPLPTPSEGSPEASVSRHVQPDIFDQRTVPLGPTFTFLPEVRFLKRSRRWQRFAPSGARQEEVDGTRRWCDRQPLVRANGKRRKRTEPPRHAAPDSFAASWLGKSAVEDVEQSVLFLLVHGSKPFDGRLGGIEVWLLEFGTSIAALRSEL